MGSDAERKRGCSRRLRAYATGEWPLGIASHPWLGGLLEPEHYVRSACTETAPALPPGDSANITRRVEHDGADSSRAKSQAEFLPERITRYSETARWAGLPSEYYSYRYLPISLLSGPASIT